MESKPQILVCADYYVPLYKAGGSVRSLANLIDALGDECQFRVVTSDRGDGVGRGPRDILANVWLQVGKAQVWYLPRKFGSLGRFRELICATPYDSLYLNSVFSPRFSIIPIFLRRCGLIPRKAIIVAPRGEFSPGALAEKRWKKRAYICVAKALGVYTDVIWHVSNAHEARDVCAIFPRANVRIAGDLTAVGRTLENADERKTDYSKAPGTLRAVFISRISPKKNLHGLLQMLRSLQGEVDLAVYGPVEDMKYWRKCEAVIESLPNTVRVEYLGALPPEKVTEVFKEYDLFVFPTRGENFGHVIIEALLAGCPVIVSDQTPWRNLEASGVGWDLPLGKPERFVEILQKCVDMRADELKDMRRRAMAYGRLKARDGEVLQQNRKLFGCLRPPFLQA